MKRIISIPLAILMLLAMIHLSVATHYCGGKVAASLISLSGKLASCGMEGQEKSPLLPGTNITTHCCDDVVISLATDNNYTPSFSVVSGSYQYQFRILSIPLGYSVNSPETSRSLYTNVIPPGAIMSTSVELSDICVFRI